MEIQDKARFKIFKTNIRWPCEQVFFDLHLMDYPGNLEEVKGTKKTNIAQAALSLNERQQEVFSGRKGEKLGPQYYRVITTKYISVRPQIFINFQSFLWSDLTVTLVHWWQEWIRARNVYRLRRTPVLEKLTIGDRWIFSQMWTAWMLQIRTSELEEMSGIP